MYKYNIVYEVFPKVKPIVIVVSILADRHTLTNDLIYEAIPSICYTPAEDMRRFVQYATPPINDVIMTTQQVLVVLVRQRQTV